MSKRTAPLLRARSRWLMTLWVIGMIVGPGAFYLGAGLRAPTAGLLGRSWDVSRAKVDVTVRPDASLLVDEQLHFRVKEKAFDDAYAAVTPGTGEVGTVRLENLAGESLDDDNWSTPLDVATEVEERTEPGPGNGFRVKGLERIDGKAEERDVQLEYDVRKAVQVYDDVVFVQWIVRSGDANGPLDRLDATIRMKGRSGETVAPIRSWVRPGPLGVRTENRDDAATLQVKGLRTKDQVVMSAMFPRDDRLSSTEGAVVRKGDGRADIEAQEDLLVARSGTGGIPTFVWKHRLLLAGLVLLLALGATTALVTVGRGYRRRAGVLKPGAAGHVPESVPPMRAFGYAALRGDESSIVLPTLLDLVDRGYYTGRVGPDGDFAISKASPRPAYTSLKPGERAVMGFFDRQLGDQSRGLADLHRSVPKHDSVARAGWNTMTKALAESAIEGLPFEGDLRPWRRRIILAGTVLLALLAVAGLGRSSDVSILAGAFPLLVGIVLVYPSHLLRPLSEKGYERHRAWKAFGTWSHRVRASDPPLDRGDVAWPRTLAYAIAFGGLGRLVAAGQLPPVGEAPEGAWWGDLAGRTPTFLAETDFGGTYGSRWESWVQAESSD